MNIFLKEKIINDYNFFQNIQFNINGVFYNRATGDDGIARLNINLMPGQYIITSMYGYAAISNTVKVTS